MGVVSLPSERFAWFGNPARPGVRTAYFAAFGPWSGALLKVQTANKVVNSPRRKGRVCAGNPRRVSCAIEIISFQNFYKVLKTCSAGRKDFFDTLSLRDSDALMRVAVPRRRGPAGLRDPVAVSLTALMGFTVLVAHDNSTPRKILVGFTHRSAPCVLPLAVVPLLCPQHPSAADKTGRWKTGSAGSCRADFRFACARPA